MDTGGAGVPAATQLHGVVWNNGASLAGIEPIHPPVVRIDASLERASTGQISSISMNCWARSPRSAGSVPNHS